MLIIVDMLNDFINKDGALYVPGSEDIVSPIKGLINNSKDQDEQIILLCDAHYTNDKEFERFPPHCVFGTKGAEVISEIYDEIGDYNRTYFIPKTRYSGFFNTDLEEIIKNYNFPATVCGVCTSICVMDTVGGLANRDIPTTVFENSVKDLPKEAFEGIDMHEASLKRMEVIYNANIVRGKK